jgi:hypothetical protein
MLYVAKVSKGLNKGDFIIFTLYSILSMPKKHKLTGDFTPDYTVIGISSQARGYKLAMLVNGKLGLRLQRVEDLSLHEKPDRAYMLYEYRAKDSARIYHLLYNRHPEGLLAPALKGIDAFLLLYESLPAVETGMILSALRKGQGIQAAYTIDIATVKGFDSLLEDLEVHLMSSRKKPEE